VSRFGRQPVHDDRRDTMSTVTEHDEAIERANT
jgi:hypothetical protein